MRKMIVLSFCVWPARRLCVADRGLL